MNAFFQSLLTASFHGSIVILAVIALRLALRKTPKKFICFLWMLAGIRLLMPIPVTSSFSLQPEGLTIPVPINPSIGLLLLWGAVAAVIGLASAISYVRLQRQVRTAVKVPGGWESDKIETAFVLGFVKPKIYIPTGMSQDTKRQILSHERTHLEKGDHWIKMIGFIALALHWFNPLVWVAYVLLCKDIEIACDQRVVQFMELEERKAYTYYDVACLYEVIWKYGDTEVHDVFEGGSLARSYTQKPDNMFYGDWTKRSWCNDEYDCYYFPADYSVISDEEITFALSGSQVNHFVSLYTYRFDEAGNLTEITKKYIDDLWNNYTIRYVITDTPESEIQAWVEQVEAAQS